MYIINQYSDMIVNTDQVTNFEISQKKDSVMAWCVGKSTPTHLGYYPGLNACKNAMDDLYMALDEGKYTYQMPNSEEMDFARPKQYGSKVTSRKRSHGGS